MVDNVTADPGTGGADFATDEIASVHYPINKITFGPLDSQTLASSGNGTTDAGTQRVTLSSDGTGQVKLAAGTALAGKVNIGAPDTGPLDLAKIEDTAYASGDVGVMMLGVRNDTNGTLVGTDGDYTPLQTNSLGSLQTHEEANTVDSGNSSTTPLGISAVFTGTAVDMLDYSAATIMLFADQDSATDGVSFQFSTDGTNWDVSQNVSYVSSVTGEGYEVGAVGQFFRIVYTNGTTGQGAFRLETILHHNTPLAGTHPLSENEDPGFHATLTKSAIIAQAAGTGDFIPIQATAGGNIKTSTQEISDGLDIGAGNAGTETQRVSISSDDVNLSAINAGQLPDGHSVTVDNASGAAAVNIQDGGNSITVDGTVTANAGTNLNTSALALETGGNLATLAGAVSGSEMQVDVVAPLPAGTNNIGDVDVATQPARAATTDNVGVAHQTNQMMDGTTSLTPKFAVIDDALSGDNTLIAAVASKKIRVLQVMLVAAGAVNARFESGAAGTALTGQMNLTTNTGFNSGFCPVGHFETAVNTLLNLELSAAVSVDGWIVYVEV